MRLTLDTNILVYALDADSGERHEQAVDLVERASRADCVLALQALSELFAVMTRRARVPVAGATAIIEDFLAVFPVVAASEVSLRQALASVRVHRLPFWDAMLHATAQEAGCRYLLSEDFQDGQTLGGVTVVNPFLAGNQRLVEKLLPRKDR